MRESALAGPCRINEGNEGKLIIGEPDFLLPHERALMVELMKRKHRAYAFNDEERGRLDVDKIPMICIHIVPHEPWNMRGARYPNPDEEKKVVDYLDDKIRMHVADYSSGPYASPWFCFIKPNGTLPWVQDLQRLNAVTVQDAGGLPNAHVPSESCAGRPIISLIDLYSVYDHFPVYPSDMPVTAMHTPRGLIHMNVAPQGWTNAVAMVQRAMIRAMQSVSPHITQPYIDDLAVKGPAVKESDEVSPGVSRFVWKHIQDLEKVLSLLEEHNLTASEAKSRHCMREATILGFDCSKKGRRPDVKKTDKITEWPVSFHSITDVRSFLDAGPTALGGVLIQVDMEGNERPLRFESRTLCTTERNYSQFKRETLVVLHCLRIFRNYIFGRRFILRVDPTALAYSSRNYVPSDPTVARWLTYIWMFNFELERIPGSKNRTDGLSRINWDKQEGEAVENTPPVDGFLDQEEDVRLHINKWSPRVSSCVGYPIWQALNGYESTAELVLKPFEEEDPWGGKDVQWMMKLALASSHSLVEDMRTIEEGSGQVERHEDLIGGMYLLVNTLLQESLAESGSLNPAGNVDEVPESQDDEFEEGEIKEAFRAEEYDRIYLELGLLLSCKMLLRDASDRAQRMLQRYLVRDGHLFVRREVGNPKRVVCGRNRQIDVVAALLDGIAGGHRGVQATHLAAYALEHPDLEESAPAEPRQEPCQPEKEMEAEIPKRVDLPARERAPAGETAEEKRVRRTRRIGEIWQERQRLEAAGELPEQQQERQRSEAAGTLPGKKIKETSHGVRLEAMEMEIQELRALVASQAAIIESLRQQTQGKVNKPESSRQGEQRQPGHGLPGQPSTAEPRQEPPMGRVILEPEEPRAKRQVEREAFEFRAPTELATLPVAAADPVVPLAVEEGLPPSSSEPAQGSAEGSMGVLLEAVHTMQEEVSLFSPEQRIEEPLKRETGVEAEGVIEGGLQRLGTPEYGPEEIEEHSMAVPGETLERRPQRLDTPKCVPVTGDLRSRLGSWATGSGSGGPVPGIEQ
ncbi:hypothetical protein CBR_g23697 [Chara braunii]|nr:hypothetical protein CBR_g23697 [Chara braunii]|eukprot:GBG77366.1 hypothetical protein CBR_g23697 [Chara braunii]